MDEKQLSYTGMVPEGGKQAQHCDEEGNERHPEGCPAGYREVPECQKKEQEDEDNSRDALWCPCPSGRHREFSPEDCSHNEHVQHEENEP